MEDGAFSGPSRAELFLVKTEIEDEIRTILPYRNRQRNSGLGLTALTAAGVVSGLLWAGNSGFLVALLAFILSIPPWFFFSLSTTDVSRLKRRVSAIEMQMEEEHR